MRRPTLFALATTAALVLAACSSSPSGSAAPSSGSEPSAAAASQAPAASQAGGGGGGGGSGTGGIGVVLSDGNWTGGNAHVNASGDLTASFDAPLFQFSSLTTAGENLLTYVNADTTHSVIIAVYPDQFAISVTTPDGVGGGGTTTNCDVSYSSNDDHQISGQFTCADSPVISATGSTIGTATLEGDFTATR